MAELNDWAKMNLPRIGVDGRPMSDRPAQPTTQPADALLREVLDRLEERGPNTYGMVEIPYWMVKGWRARVSGSATETTEERS